MFVQLLVMPVLLVLTVFVLFSWVPDVSLACELNILPVCCCSSILHIIFSNPNSSISSIPKSAEPSHGTAKNLHVTSLSLFLNQTEHIPNCSMFELLYVFRVTELSFVVCIYSMVVLGNRHLNILNGMKLASSLESILYVTLVCL